MTELGLMEPAFDDCIHILTSEGFVDRMQKVVSPLGSEVLGKGDYELMLVRLLISEPDWVESAEDCSADSVEPD
jgi:hypothetical protein